MRKTLRKFAVLAATGMFALPAVASAQTWANWTSFTNGVGVFGNLGSLSISHNSAFNGYQLSDGVTRSAGVTSSPNCGYNFFCTPVPYTSAGVGAPTNHGFVQYTGTQAVTITFSSAVLNPLFSFISTGQLGAPVGYDFGLNSFSVLSHNTGLPAAAAWGDGTHTVAGNVLTGREFSGTIRLNGSFTSVSFNVLNAENWHGVTVGMDTPENVVPEPSTYALMGAGLLGIGGFARRRRKV